MVGENQQRREDDKRFLDHEKRLHNLEPVVESLQWHHRNDRVLERLTDLEASRSQQPKKVEGNGDMRARIGWLEKVAFMAIGAIAAFEFYTRVIK